MQLMVGNLNEGKELKLFGNSDNIEWDGTQGLGIEPEEQKRDIEENDAINGRAEITSGPNSSNWACYFDDPRVK